MRHRGGRELVLIDIAVPRDVDPACGDIAGVRLYDVDDLQNVVRRTTHVRELEARRAEDIVEQEIERFAEWLGSRAVLPTIAALRQQGTEIVESVLAENENRWESASPADLARVEALARAVMNRLLHEPTLRMKATDPNRAHGRMSLVRELFGMDDGASVDVPETEQPAEVRRLPQRGA